MNTTGFSQAMVLTDAPDVLGYIFFFEIGSETYFDTDRVVRVGATTVNCPDITPDNEGKLFARHGYKKSEEFGNLDYQNEPDAYIFKGKALKDAQMKLLHTYRLMKPAALGP